MRRRGTVLDQMPPVTRAIVAARPCHLWVTATGKGVPDRRLFLREWPGGWLLESVIDGHASIERWPRTDWAGFTDAALSIAETWVRDGLDVIVACPDIDWFPTGERVQAHLDRVRREVMPKVA